MKFTRRMGFAIVFSAASAAIGTAAAQDFPTKPIKLIVGYAAGGPTDVIARLVGQDISAALGQPVVVENRAGANGNIGTESVARSPADGYTLIVNTLSHNVNPLLHPETVKYDPVKDFVPISLAVVLPQLVVVANDSPFKSLADVVKQAKASPGAVSRSLRTNRASVSPSCGKPHRLLLPSG